MHLSFLHKLWIALCLLLGLSGFVAAQPVSCGTPGLDGSVYANPSYFPGAATANVGQPVVQVGTIRTGTGAGTSVLAPGDLVMVIQMQDAFINNGNSVAYGDGTTGRGWTALNNAGRYEFRRVVSVAGTNVTLDQNLSFTYTRANPSAGTGASENGNRRFQVIRVPQYASVTLPGGTLSPPAWNGETGGVWPIDVSGNLNMNGATVDASSRGFRGGASFPNNQTNGRTDYANTVTVVTTLPAGTCAAGTGGVAANVGAFKGEGIAGTPRFIRRQSGGTNYEIAYAYLDLLTSGYPAGRDLARGAAGNAGGGGTQHNTGGGGGSNAGLGGLGGNSFAYYNAGGTCVSFTGGNPNPFLACNGDGARAVGGLGGGTQTAAIDNLLMGGGGGGGDNNNACDNPTIPQGAGGNGGGIIFIKAGTVSGGGSLLANGQNALPGGRDAAGGGGAGGTIVVLTGTNAPGFALVQANGGQGGNTGWTGTGGTVGTTLLVDGETQGPGGGGGGGAVVRSSNVTLPSQFNGGLSGANFPDANTAITNRYGSGSGGGISATAPFVPTTTSLGGNCLPQLQTTKRTTTPVVTFPQTNTAVYIITITNSGGGGGAAAGVTVQDTLQAPFAYTPTLAPINAIAVSYVGNASGPGTPVIGTGTQTFTIGTPGSNLLSNTFLLPNNATISFTVTVTINGAGTSPTLGTVYQNSVTVNYLDPLRTTSTTQVSPGGTYTPGGAVPGSNYTSTSSINEDVRVVGNTSISVTKDNGTTTLAAGQTTSYTITVANLGPNNAPGVLVTDPFSSGLSCTTVTCAVTAGIASCPALSVSTLQTPGLVITPNFNAGSTLSFVLTCNVTATGQP